MTSVALPLPAPRVRESALRQEILRLYRSLDRQSDWQVLGLETGAGPDAVRAAYQRLARRFHPDCLGSDASDLAPQSQAIFIRATEAARALSGHRGGSRRASLLPRSRENGTIPDQVEARPPRPSGAGRRPAAPAPASARSANARPDAAGPIASLNGPPPVRRPPAPDVPAGTNRTAGHAVHRQTAADCASEPLGVADALRQAQERLDRDDVRGAVGLLHGVLARAGEEAGRRVRLLLARGYMREAGWRRYAVAQLRSLVEERPLDAEALSLLGAAYRAEGLLARAESAFKRAYAADPELREVRTALREIQAEREGTRTGSRPVAPRRGILKRLLRRKK